MAKKKFPSDLKWNWQRVMDWFGAEGSVYVGKVNRYIAITQADRSVLDEICQFIKGQGVKRYSIYYDKQNRNYHFKLYRVEDQRTFINKGRPYAPTKKACDDLDKFEKAIKGVKGKKFTQNENIFKK